MHNTYFMFGPAFTILMAGYVCAGNNSKIMVFVETKRNADFLAAFLSDQGQPTTSIHGDRLQSERELALRDFRTGRMRLLVATAVAARGLGTNLILFSIF